MALLLEDIVVEFSGFQALRQVTLQIAEKELRFLIGPNGAGKTTLLDVICGKTRPIRGKVLFQGHDLTRLSDYRIARLGIARKFQAPSIFPALTVIENLELAALALGWQRARKVELRERMERVLVQVGLSDMRQKRAGDLSHGQKQWLEIGMLLVQDPTVLLLDEPIAGMSHSEREKTGLLLQEIARDRTVVVVEHDMDFVREFSHIVTVLHEGQVLCEGSMEDIQKNPIVEEVYLGRRTAPLAAAHGR